MVQAVLEDKEDSSMINAEEEVITLIVEVRELVEAKELMVELEVVTDQIFTIPVPSLAIKQLTGYTTRGDRLKSVIAGLSPSMYPRPLSPKMVQPTSFTPFPAEEGCPPP